MTIMTAASVKPLACQHPTWMIDYSTIDDDGSRATVYLHCARCGFSRQLHVSARPAGVGATP